MTGCDRSSAGDAREVLVEFAAGCTGRQGLRHHCTLAALHEGDHVSGDRTWARTPRELAADERHRVELAKLRERVIRLRPDAETGSDG